MKKFLICLSLTAIALTTWHCDEIEAPYGTRQETIISADTLYLPITEADRKARVLLEEYTGHRCGNCPRAAEEAKNLMGIYGDQISIIAVHAGHFAGTKNSGDKYLYDFTTPTGDAFNTEFGNSNAGLPNGLVNRKENTTGSKVVAHSSWNSLIAAELNRPLEAAMTMRTEYKTDGKDSICTYIYTELTDSTLATDNDYLLMVLVTEDSIINWQKDYSKNPQEAQDIEDYVHRHVLRGSINGGWGVPVTFTGGTSKRTFCSSIAPDWKREQLHLVAVLYKEDTKEVVQVIESKLP